MSFQECISFEKDLSWPACVFEMLDVDGNGRILKSLKPSAPFTQEN